ncbi:MAG: FAD:protein FMN transferase [Planctomycetales bacterium]|nr:FAD:protein FMN transferase [Planctomycetales bacterium]
MRRSRWSHWFACGLIVAAGCRGKTNVDRTPLRSAVLRGDAMGTTWTVRFARPLAENEAADYQRGVAAELEGVEAEMSHWRHDSALSQLNRSAAKNPFPVSPALATVLAEACAISDLTGGALDVTVSPLVALWGFGPQATERGKPTDAQIAAALAHVGSDKFALEFDEAPNGKGDAQCSQPQVQKLDPLVCFDLSSLAKGYAIDRVAEYLDQRGCDNYLIELGGELRARGRSDSGRPWRAGLEAPDRQVAGRVRRKLALTDAAIATSGSYRQFRVASRDRQAIHSHLIDPRSGRPCAHALVSVSVIADSAMRADALATALFVLGPREGLALAEREGIAATFVEQSDGPFVERQSSSFPANSAMGNAP